MLRQIILVAVILLIASCATTQLSNVVVNPDFQGPIKSVMVMGSSANNQNRAAFEQEFALLFQKNGVRAVQSRDPIPRFQAVTDQQIKDIVREQGVEAVFVARVVDVGHDNTYVAPAFVYYRPYYSPFYMNAAVRPGYVATTTTIFIEVTLHNATRDELIWSATSASFNPTKLDDVLDELGRTVIEQFRKNGLL